MQKIKDNPIKSAILACFLFVLCGAAIETHYSQLSAAPAQTHDEITSVDSSGIGTTPDTTHLIQTFGNPKLTAHVNGSTSGATCVIACYRWLKTVSGGTTTWTYLGKTHSGTLTLDDRIEVTGDGSGEDALSKYGLLTSFELDTQAAPWVEVRVDTLSGGNLSVWPWVYGSASQGQ